MLTLCHLLDSIQHLIEYYTVRYNFIFVREIQSKQWRLGCNKHEYLLTCSVAQRSCRPCKAAAQLSWQVKIINAFKDTSACQLQYSVIPSERSDRWRESGIVVTVTSCRVKALSSFP